MTKIVVGLPAGGRTSAELLWAEPLGDDRYELKNVPVWAYGLAYEDVVEGRADEDDGRVHFVRVVRSSGLLTVRAAGPGADPKAMAALIEALQKKSVASERYSATYAAFAMTREAFLELEGVADEAERAGTIFVEIANDDS